MAAYISREEVLEHSGYTGNFNLVVPVRFIKAMKAADVQLIKHGRWENKHIEDDEAWWADCTNCKSETHSKFGRVSLYAFCPNRGARMDLKDGERNENN